MTADRISTSVKERTYNDMTSKAMFKEYTGTSVMEFYKSLKVEESKKLIREGQINFRKIAQKLGYSSSHYFSRHLKKATNMTPSQYSSYVKIKL
ncbi:helix-turn-helix domain-containing protein [Clostridium grantii]|uniref:helix-turn-helix domain-containing protein n=1 Tax=Clostridium grantii TaxID=40575 RepID=UPI0009340668|nr:helix-turn-helix transcriptional regulator [Clostridium grantii]